MKPEDQAAETRALRESTDRLRVAIEDLLDELRLRRPEEEPPDAAAAGFDRYRARLKRGGA